MSGSTKFKNKIHFKIILVLWVANGGSPRLGPYLQTHSSVTCTSSCTRHCWIIHCCSFCCWAASTYGLCRLQKHDIIFPQPVRLSICLSVLPKEGLSEFYTAAASSNSNPKALQCLWFSSVGPQLLPSTLDFSSQACRSISPWIIEVNSHLPKEKLREYYILPFCLIFSSLLIPFFIAEAVFHLCLYWSH